MINNFKEELEIVRNNNIDKLLKLDKVLKKLKKYVCRGEVSIVDTKNSVICQTHFEYFTISVTSELIIIKRHNIDNNIGTLDYIHIDTNKIIDYEINQTSFILNGKLDDNYKMQILIVFKDELKSS